MTKETDGFGSTLHISTVQHLQYQVDSKAKKFGTTLPATVQLHSQQICIYIYIYMYMYVVSIYICICMYV